MAEIAVPLDMTEVDLESRAAGESRGAGRDGTVD